MLLGVLTAVLIVAPIDLVVSGWFWDASSGWMWKDALLPRFIYDKGPLPGIWVAGVALFVLAFGVKSDTFRRYRKVSAYLVLAMVVGPGLLINAVLKDQWGRPRPRDVEEFGGRERFESVWEYDGASGGKSFASGHASMGFYFFAVYFLVRSWSRGWAWGAGLGALAFGLALGFTRIVQGGHFVSDVLWSGGICYFLSAGLFYGLGLHRGWAYDRPARERSPWKWLALALVVAGAAVVSVLIPWQEEKHLTAKVVAGEPARVTVRIPEGDLFVKSAAVPRFAYEAHVEGFGLPGSRVLDSLKEEAAATDRPQRIRLEQRVRGYFFALEQPAEVTLPILDPESVIEIELSDGNLKVDLRHARPGQRWKLVVGGGDLTLELPASLPVKVDHGPVGELHGSVRAGGGIVWDEDRQIWKRGEGDKVSVEVEAKKGDIVLDEYHVLRPMVD